MGGRGRGKELSVPRGEATNGNSTGRRGIEMRSRKASQSLGKKNGREVDVLSLIRSAQPGMPLLPNFRGGMGRRERERFPLLCPREGGEYLFFVLRCVGGDWGKGREGKFANTSIVILIQRRNRGPVAISPGWVGKVGGIQGKKGKAQRALSYPRESRRKKEERLRFDYARDKGALKGKGKGGQQTAGLHLCGTGAKEGGGIWLLSNS